METQKNTDPPYAIVLQEDHARLAGELSTILRPNVFGPLPDEVIQAIAIHDIGWRSADEDQLLAIGEKPPMPFPLLAPETTIPYWRESVRMAQELSPLAGVIVSRHFCAVATQDAAHQAFIDTEEPRREKLESTLGVDKQDLDRWTAAIGFCDLLSLYLCCGATDPGELPLAHPALPESRNARKVFVEWANGKPRFSSPVMKSDTVKGPIRERADKTARLELRTISWTFEQ